MVLIIILLMLHDAASGDDLFITSNFSSVADTINLRCIYHVFVLRSLPELAITCSREPTCCAIRTEDEGASKLWCACPKQITWPRSEDYVLSTMRMRHLMEHIPGISNFRLKYQCELSTLYRCLHHTYFIKMKHFLGLACLVTLHRRCKWQPDGYV